LRSGRSGRSRASITAPGESRGIWYGGLTLACAVVDAFDSGIVDPRTTRLVRARTTRALDLLDLRGRAAMRAGTVAAIAAGDHVPSRAWSRYVHEDSDGRYGAVDGLHGSAHNGDPAVALYERAAGALAVPACHDTSLIDAVVLASVRRIARQHGLLVAPERRG
jgi:hypothetical protein